MRMIFSFVSVGVTVHVGFYKACSATTSAFFILINPVRNKYRNARQDENPDLGNNNGSILKNYDSSGIGKEMKSQSEPQVFEFTAFYGTVNDHGCRNMKYYCRYSFDTAHAENERGGLPKNRNTFKRCLLLLGCQKIECSIKCARIDHKASRDV